MFIIIRLSISSGLFMGYHPQNKSPRNSNRGYKPPYGKDKDRKRKSESAGNSAPKEKHVASLKEISERTLQELRVLGNQKFGSSPFSEHFDRWLLDLTEVLSEFESNLNVNADGEFVKERSQILSAVKVELEQRRHTEASFDDAAKKLLISKNLLARINADYVAKMSEISGQKNSKIRRLYRNIDDLKKELDDVIRMKSGLFRGISKKNREQKETEKTQELIAAQRQLELAMLEFTEAKERLRDEYERNRQPVIEQLRDWQKKNEILESDGSREDRWFACDALVDAVNAFLQRKTLKFHPPV
jgi:hypothetical protein